MAPLFELLTALALAAGAGSAAAHWSHAPTSVRRSLQAYFPSPAQPFPPTRRRCLTGEILAPAQTLRSPIVGEACVAWDLEQRHRLWGPSASRHSIPFVMRTPAGDVRLRLDPNWRIIERDVLAWDLLSVHDDPPADRDERRRLRATTIYERVLVPGDVATIAGVFVRDPMPPTHWDEPFDGPRLLVRPCGNYGVTTTRGSRDDAFARECAPR